MAKTDDNYTEGDIVEVRCVDIAQNAEWSSVRNIRNKVPAPAKWVGYFLCGDDDQVTILSAYSYHEGNEDASYTVFPRAIIKSIEKIQESELDDLLEK